MSSLVSVAPVRLRREQAARPSIHPEGTRRAEPLKPAQDQLPTPAQPPEASQELGAPL